MLVRIVNNPFAAPAADVNVTIVSQMQGRTAGPPTRLALEPTDRMIPGYAIALGFDLPVWYDPGALCRPVTAAPAANTSAPRLTLLMVFCEGDAWLTWVKGSVPRVASVDDPLFRQLIATSTFQLIPLRDDQWQGIDRDARRTGASLVAR